MRNLSQNLLLHLAGGATTLCHCWRVIRRDGIVLGFTDHDVDLTIGTTLYAARTGMEGTDIEANLGFSVGGAEVSGALVADILTEADLANGRYDGAGVEIWLVNWAETTQKLLLDLVSIGEVRRTEFAFTAELRSLAHDFDQEKGRLFQAACTADLGDGRCGVDLTISANCATGSIVSVNGPLDFAAGPTGHDAGWFSGGAITFLSGANKGTRVEVKLHGVDASSSHFAIWTALAAPPAIGDQFRVTAGCNKAFATCRDKFGNLLNFRGFPNMPGNDHIISYPNQGDSGLDGGSFFR